MTRSNGTGDGDLASAVVRHLEEARRAGILGPGPVEEHLAHARGFVEAAAAVGMDEEAVGTVVDLGSGGGVPGLVLATAWRRARIALLEGSSRRAQLLRRAVVRCRLDDRVTVWEARAEEVGRDPERRGRADVVVARAFGPPAVTAECAAPLLRVGGSLVVSEPPGDGAGRWPPEPLGELGLGTPHAVRHRFGYCVMTLVEPCPARYPRRVGIPAKRPLF